MQYRRTYIPSTSYFFTVNLADRSKTLLVDHINALREAIRIVKQRHPFQIDAVVILPDTYTLYGHYHQMIRIMPCAGC